MSDISDRSLRVAMSGIVHDDDPTIIADMMVRIETLEAALKEITKGEGAFSRDPLTHATSTIESMKQIALDALASTE